MLFWLALSGIRSQPIRLSDVLNFKNSKKLTFATIQATKNIMLFWVMAPKSFWPISLHNVLLLTCLTF